MQHDYGIALHKNKIAVLRGYLDTFARLADWNYEIKLNISVLVASAEITVKETGMVIPVRCVEYQIGGAGDCYRLATEHMQDALRALGVEFVTMKEAAGKV